MTAASSRASLARGLRRATTVLLMAVGAGALVLGTPSAALAHDGLVGTVPAGGATVEGLPPAVELDFTGEPLPLGTLVAVTGPDGGIVSSGDAEIRGTTVVQALAGDPVPGTYRVEWRSTSSDGHALSGSFDFTVGTAGTPSAAVPDGVPSPAAEARPAPAQADDTAGVPPIWPAAGAVVLVGLGAVLVTRIRRRP